MAGPNVVPLRRPVAEDGIAALLADCRIKRLQAMHGLATLIRDLGDGGATPDHAFLTELEAMLARLSAIEIGAAGAPDGGATGLAEAAARLQDVHAALMAIIARSGAAGRR